jgi:hypothetical protein
MLFRTGYKIIEVLSMMCSLFMALRGCRRGRWHDSSRGENGQMGGMEGKVSSDLL